MTGECRNYDISLNAHLVDIGYHRYFDKCIFWSNMYQKGQIWCPSNHIYCNQAILQHFQFKSD